MGKILARGPEDGSQGQRRSPWIFAIFTKFPARFQNWWVVSTSLKNIKFSWDYIVFPIYGKIKAVLQATNQKK
jgi:hypothetical protein